MTLSLGFSLCKATDKVGGRLLFFMSLCLNAKVTFELVPIDIMAFEGPCGMTALELAGRHESVLTRWNLEQSILDIRRLEKPSRISAMSRELKLNHTDLTFCERALYNPKIICEIAGRAKLNIEMLKLDCNGEPMLHPIRTELLYGGESLRKLAAERRVSEFLNNSESNLLHLLCCTVFEGAGHVFLITLNKYHKTAYVYLDPYTTYVILHNYISWINRMCNPPVVPREVAVVGKEPVAETKKVRAKNNGHFLESEFSDLRRRMAIMRLALEEEELADRRTYERVAVLGARVARVEKAVARKKKSGLPERKSGVRKGKKL